MKRLNLVTAVLFFGILLIISCESKKEDVVNSPSPVELRQIANQFTDKLGGVLMNEMKEGGALNAVNVCYHTAQTLSRDFGIEHGVLIKRVSLKNRNANNAPDEFEAEILSKFENWNESGMLDTTTEYFEIVTEYGKKQARYMKPIIVKQLCLNCHGDKEKMDKQVLKEIESKYKNDRAVNYKVGELRGAVSIIKNL